ncbi:DUF2442 domain-containing protein [Runella sp. CRIBMP]|uniref:DUF2442 domain-containing protein n=1 Tax=Runella sp. CRIBMP TaxID=2683261 RepID=UPI00141314EC|nr:DUF2442 domain-containing protein [Runella sp. CRIBMP]NBB18505.1 DUF2442 domain-containing protein [Runella sp. CRIBMP]
MPTPLIERPKFKDLPTFTKVEVTDSQVGFWLNDGREVWIPLEWSDLLKNASPIERQNFKVSGYNLFWETIDEIIGIENVLYGKKLWLYLHYIAAKLLFFA